MDATALLIFIETVRRGSFSAVARDRDLDPSAVSRMIGGLERQLGVRLFERTTRRLVLTEAGQVYFERVEPLVEELERARLAVTDLGARMVGTLRVTTSASFGQSVIVPLLPAFTTANPDLTIELILTDTVLDIVTERIDVAIRLGRLADSSLVASQLMSTRYFVCASPGYLAGHSPIGQPNDLREHDCLLFPLTGFRSRWIFRDREGVRTEIPVKGRLIVSMAAALGQCAVAGMGPALLPHWIVADDLKRGTLTDLFPDQEVTATDFDTAVWFLHASRRYVPAKVRVFRDFVSYALRRSG